MKNKSNGKTIRRLTTFFVEQRLFVIMLLMIIILTVSTKGIFIRPANINNLLNQNVIIAVIALAQTFVIITGGIDLSVGSIAGFSALMYVMNQDVGLGLSIVLTILIGAVFGMINGAAITMLRVPALVATLATMSIYRGAALLMVDGSPIFKICSEFLAIGDLEFLGLRLNIYICIVLFIILWLVLNKTKLGKEIYATGGNDKTAYASGINTKRVRFSVYAMSGAVSAIAGIFYTAKMGAGDINVGATYHMDSIAAVVIGGASLSGGEGKLFYTIIGVLIFGMLNNFLNLIGVPSYLQQGVKGLIIILAVYANIRSRKRA